MSLSPSDRVIGWGNRIMSTIGGGGGGGGGGGEEGGEVCNGAHTHTLTTTTDQNTTQNEEEEGGLSLPHFNPSLPPHPRTSKTPRNHKRRRSFLGRRRNTDHRRGNGNTDLSHVGNHDDHCHGNSQTGHRCSNSHKGSSIFLLPFRQSSSHTGLAREGAGR